MRPRNFQSGPKNHRYLPVGTVRVRRKRGKIVRPVVEVKVADEGPEERRWRYLARVVWEAANGPLARGLVLRHRNGNPVDCRLTNLEAVTPAEVLRRSVAADPERARAGWSRGGRTQCARPEFRRRSAEARRMRAARERRIAERGARSGPRGAPAAAPPEAPAD